MPNDFDNKVKNLTTSSRRSFFGNFREVDVFRHGLDWSRKQKINRCKRVSVAQQSYLRCGMFLIEQVGNHARPSRVTRAVDVFTFVFHHPISLSRSDNKGPTNDDTIDAVIYRFLTIYAKTLQPAPFDCLFACERERRACHMGCSERGKKNISKYQTYTKQQQQKSANKRKKNFLLRFFSFSLFPPRRPSQRAARHIRQSRCSTAKTKKISDPKRARKSAKGSTSTVR